MPAIPLWKIFLLFGLLALPGNGVCQTDNSCAQAHILIKMDGPQQPVNRLLFGQNVLFAGNGMWDAARDDLCAQAAQFIKRLKPTVLRFPGGSISNRYIWEDGVGVRTASPTTLDSRELTLKSDPHWDGVTQAYLVDAANRQNNEVVSFDNQVGKSLLKVKGLSKPHPAGSVLRPERRPGQPKWISNGYGILEHLKLCEALGAQPVMTINYGTGVLSDGMVSSVASLSQKIKRAAAWVAFVNGRSDDNRSLGMDEEGNDWHTVAYWARKREARGHPQPYGVTDWEIGNEQYDCHEAGFTSAQQYGKHFVLFARAMKEVDSKIKIGAVGLADRPKGDVDGDGPWNATVLKLTRDYVDFLVLHPYYPTASAAQAQSYRSPAWFTAVMGAASQALMHLKEIRALINASCDRGREIKIVISEYGLWPADSKSGQDFSNLARALCDADLLLTLLKHGQELGVEMATGWNLHGNNQTAAIKFDFCSEARILRPQYFVYELLQATIGRNIIPVQVTSPVCDIPHVGNVGPLQDISCLQALATPYADGHISLWVINRSLDRDLTTAITLPGHAATSTERIFTLGGPSLAANNETHFGQIGVRSKELNEIGPTLNYTFPAHSLTVIVKKLK
jgi:alpha-L-arabinofuranosidase